MHDMCPVEEAPVLTCKLAEHRFDASAATAGEIEIVFQDEQGLRSTPARLSQNGQVALEASPRADAGEFAGRVRPMCVEEADVRCDPPDAVQLIRDFAPPILPVHKVDDPNFIEALEWRGHSEASFQGAGGREGVSVIDRNKP